MSKKLSFALTGLLASTLTLQADTPFKGGPSAFGSNSASPAASSKVAVAPSSVKVVTPPPATVTTPPASDISQRPTSIVSGSPVNTDIKAASIEVAWLQDSSTYPLRLRAETAPGGDAIILTGYLPHERLREKAVAIAHRNAGTAVVIDQLVVHNAMALPALVATDAEQRLLIQVALEATSPGLSNNLQITVDANGIATVTGLVEEFTDRRKIIRGLQAIPGCQAIRYDLKVSAPATVQTASASATLPAIDTNVVLESRQLVKDSSSGVSSSALSSVTPQPAKVSAKSSTFEPAQPVPLEPVYPQLPSVNNLPRKNKVPDLIVPSGSKPEAMAPASKPARNMITTSSLSGLFPPGATDVEEYEATHALLGQPIVRVQHTINLDVMEPVIQAKRVVTRPIVLDESVTRSASIVPASAVVPAEEDQVPALIPVMPRLYPGK